MLTEIAVLLFAALLMVPLSRRLGAGAVVGYLFAGAVLGPWGLNVVNKLGEATHVADLGVVMLLFLIGLEMDPKRLWILRKPVFILGGGQYLLTALTLGVLFWLMDFSLTSAIVIALALGMSSTAFVLQLLSEKQQLGSRLGRQSFSVLLFQDLAVIPVLALLPVLAHEHATRHGSQGAHWLIVLAVLGGLVLSSRLLVRPFFRYVMRSGAHELSTAMGLFMVLGVTLLMEVAGMSATLGAFVAGVLLADSEYRHDLEAHLQPFKGLLLGFFFMSVGMSANLDLLAAKPALVIAGAIGLMLLKALLLAIISYASGHDARHALRLGLTLSQGGEFAFVVFTSASGLDLLPGKLTDTLILVVTLSMALTPLVLLIEEKGLRRWLRKEPERGWDTPENEEHPVVIAGFGRFGQIIARVLRMHRIGFTALDSSAHQVDFVRRFGNKVYYGDPSSLPLLRAAGVDKAKVFVIAMDNSEDSLSVAKIVKTHFPKLTVLARARNRIHAYQLMELGITLIDRETFLSSLSMSRKVLVALGIPEADAEHAITLFRDYDEDLLKRQQAIYQNEAMLIESNRQAMDELKGLFEADDKIRRRVDNAPGMAQQVTHAHHFSGYYGHGQDDSERLKSSPDQDKE